MLFEALTGEVPFSGTAAEMIVAKQVSEAPRARDLAAWRRRPAAERAAAKTLAIPAEYAAASKLVVKTMAGESTLDSRLPFDLETLCGALLARSPSARPDEAEMHQLLGIERFASEALRGSRWSILPEVVPDLVGREAELDVLRAAYGAVRSGSPTVVFVSGESGMGKSALCDAFLKELRSEGHAVALTGRCYERENVPYKGFDALVDELSRWLRAAPREQALEVLPREVFALVRLFPVLGRVSIVAETAGKEIHDPQELRSRALAALRELLWAIGRRGPLVLYIDDLQWLDRDTTALLGYLLAQRDALPGLVLFSHRDEGADDNAMLQAIFDAARENSALDVRELRVGPLPESAARALAERCLGTVHDGQSLATGVIREAQGSPFFVGELSAFRQAPRSRNARPDLARGCARQPRSRAARGCACVARVARACGTTAAHQRRDRRGRRDRRPRRARPLALRAAGAGQDGARQRTAHRVLSRPRARGRQPRARRSAPHRAVCRARACP